MNESGTRDQDEGMIDMQWVEDLSEQLEHVRLPPATPPDGELALTATDLSHAGDDTPMRASAPPLNHYPSPRVRTNSRPPPRRTSPVGERPSGSEGARQQEGVGTQ
eukprot:9821419-Prorocentrum_lima.AAC.1